MWTLPPPREDKRAKKAVAKLEQPPEDGEARGLAGLGALEEPDADVKARMAKLNVEAAELRIVIARAHRAKTPRDRALADEIRKLELELGVAKKGQAVANREKKASQKGYSVSIDEEDPHARSGLTPPRSSTRRNWLSNAAFFGLGPS